MARGLQHTLKVEFLDSQQSPTWLTILLAKSDETINFADTMLQESRRLELIEHQQ